LLASAVVLGHAPGFGFQASGGLLGTRFLAPYYAVQAFFVISGFVSLFGQDLVEFFSLVGRTASGRFGFR
jgi:hypothetical protein